MEVEHPAKLYDLAKNTPQIPGDFVYPIWDWDYYDGPLSGVCEINGEKLFYSLIDISYNPQRTRTYLVWKPTVDDLQWAAKEESRKQETPKPDDEPWNYVPRIKVTQDQVVGWFSDDGS